jgi:hypothetical protein
MYCIPLHTCQHAGALPTTTRTSPTPRRRTVAYKDSSFTLWRYLVSAPLRNSLRKEEAQVRQPLDMMQMFTAAKFGQLCIHVPLDAHWKQRFVLSESDSLSPDTGNPAVDLPDNLRHSLQTEGARGSLVVKALDYKPEDCGFETRWGDILNLLNPSGVYSASNRNEYRRHKIKLCFWGVKCGRCVGLTTLSLSQLLRNGFYALEISQVSGVSV